MMKANIKKSAPLQFKEYNRLFRAAFINIRVAFFILFYFTTLAAV